MRALSGFLAVLLTSAFAAVSADAQSRMREGGRRWYVERLDM